MDNDAQVAQMLQEAWEEGWQEGFKEGLAFRVPCRGTGNPNLVQQVFAGCWPDYNINAEASQIKTEGTGLCIWTVVLSRKNGTPFDTADAGEMARRFRVNRPQGVTFVSCGRHGINNNAVVAKYKVNACRCVVDIDETPTQFPASGKLRFCSDAFIDVKTLIDVFSSFRATEVDAFLSQLFEDVIYADSNNDDQDIQLQFITDIEDEPYYNIEAIHVKPIEIKQTIKTIINSVINNH